MKTQDSAKDKPWDLEQSLNFRLSFMLCVFIPRMCRTLTVHPSPQCTRYIFLVSQSLWSNFKSIILFDPFNNPGKGENRNKESKLIEEKRGFWWFHHISKSRYSDSKPSALLSSLNLLHVRIGEDQMGSWIQKLLGATDVKRAPSFVLILWPVSGGCSSRTEAGRRGGLVQGYSASPRPFGKAHGRPLSILLIDYLSWVCRNIQLCPQPSTNLPLAPQEERRTGALPAAVHGAQESDTT